MSIRCIMADSRIKSASEILSAFFDRDLVKQGEYYALFDKSWKSIAGPRLAPHSRPVDIRHGLLIVETEHQGWIQLLQIQQDKMLGEIQRRFPELGVRTMAFKLGDAKEAGPQKRTRVELKTGEGVDTQEGQAESPPVTEDMKEKARASSTALPGELKDLFEKIRKNIGH